MSNTENKDRVFMTGSLTRAGKAGDMCALLVPDDDERLFLRKDQQALVDQYGGWMVAEPHITCQRFRLIGKTRLSQVITGLQTCFAKELPFTVYSNGLAMFLA